MTKEDREYVLKLHGNGVQVDEIATMAGVSESTVRRLLNKAFPKTPPKPQVPQIILDMRAAEKAGVSYGAYMLRKEAAANG